MRKLTVTARRADNDRPWWERSSVRQQWPLYFGLLLLGALGSGMVAAIAAGIL
jgi:hypothetical protein